jgi:hypothetical protein
MSDARIEPYVAGLSPAPRLDEAGTWQPPRRKRHGVARWLAPLFVLLASATLLSVFWQPRLGAPAATAPEGGLALPAGSASPRNEPGDVARYPIPAAAAPQPPLDASDAVLEAGLRALLGAALGAILEPGDVVRNFVATVDNLPRRSLFASRMPVKPAPGPFETTFAPSGLAIAEGNAARYAAYVALLQRVDAARLVALYERHYPLFAQAHRDLGYPNGHFNDRLVEAIDVALATPEIAAPLRVVQPKINYEFVDRGLETLPAAQKALLRMGPGNAAIVKGELARIRALLTRHAAPAAER